MKTFSGFARSVIVPAVLTLLLLTAAVCGQSASGTPWSPDTSPLAAPTGAVNDYAGVIDAATKVSLEQKLAALKKADGVELAVAVVQTTGDRDIFDYSLAVARGWGIGSKDLDNPSALLFIAVNDRKYFTQVSRDLEDELPDGLVGSLQRQYLVPEFRKQNYGKGISDTVDAYIATIKQRRSGAPPPAAATDDKSDGSFSSICVIGIIVLVLLVLFSRSGGGGGRGGGNRWGGGFGGGGSALPWIIGSVINSASSSGSSSGWGSGGGGSSGGWGGFGGGGDFGGGGSGGSW